MKLTKKEIALLKQLVASERRQMNGPTVDPSYKAQLTKLLNKLKNINKRVPKVCHKCGHVMAMQDDHACPYCGKYLEDV